MAVAYKKEEILSASRVARSFGKVLTDLKAQHRRRVVVLKNNQMEAVIVPVDDYEKLQRRSISWNTWRSIALSNNGHARKGRKPSLWRRCLRSNALRV